MRVDDRPENASARSWFSSELVVIAAGVLTIVSVALPLASCDVFRGDFTPPSRIVERISDPEAQVVRLACGEEYKVIERTQPQRLILATSLGQEYGREPCPGFEALNKLERFRKLALEHLANTGRKACTVTGEKVVAATEVSVLYRCPGDGKDGEGEAKKPRRSKGRPG